MTYKVPAGMSKAELYSRPTPKQMKDSLAVESMQKIGLERLVNKIDAATFEHATHIDRIDLFSFVPKNYKNRASIYYKKRGRYLDITDAPGETPMQKLKAALADSDDPTTFGYGYRTLTGNEVQIVPITEILEGRKLFSYEKSKAEAPKKVKFYDDTSLVKDEGAIGVTQVSSRRPKRSKYVIIVSGIPKVRGDTWRNVRSDHECESRMWAQVKYQTGQKSAAKKKEKQALLEKLACSHFIEGYDTQADACFNLEHNDLPARYNPFAYVSQELVNFYKKLQTRTFITLETKSKKTGKVIKRNRLLNQAECERLIQVYIRSKPFEYSFSGKTKVKDLSWTVPLLTAS
jgi:hypothetical protein